MTDFSSLISNPKLMLIGAAAQIGIFAAYMGALALGFPANGTIRNCAVILKSMKELRL